MPGFDKEIESKLEEITLGDSGIPNWSVPDIPLDKIPDSLDPSKLMDTISTGAEQLIEKAISPTSEAPNQSIKENTNIPSHPKEGGSPMEGLPSSSNTDENGLTETEKEYNKITAEYGIELWHNIVEAGSMMIYGIVNNPKEALKYLDEYEEIINNGNSLKEKQIKHRKQLRKHIEEFEKRKKEFAFQTKIKADLKQLSKDMTAKVMNVKGYKSDPSIVLVLLIVAPILINVMRIFMDKVTYKKSHLTMGVES